MYISNLKIQGFKSFLPKTKLQFGNGITCIVGPNGCGKTNIVDAIRWILGEQKISVLRSAKMDEIIFNGSKNKKPIGFCEVSLTIHNDKGRLPIEYTDVDITRRYFRSGESQYFINKVPCRLKDITNLFIDTGMGANAYSVIELKMIETILSNNASDRRRLIEEAAGVSQYKNQKLSTIRKLESTKSNLDRVKDIIAEIETNVKNLNLQMKRFERHKTLKEKIKTTEITLGQAKLQILHNEERPLKEHIAKEQSDRTSLSEKVSLDESILLKMEINFKKSREALEENRSELASADEELRKTNENILVWTEQKKSNELRIQQFEDEEKQSIERIKVLGEQIVEIENQYIDFQPKIEARTKDFQSKKNEYEIIQTKYQTKEDMWKTLRNEYDVHMDYIHQLRAKLERTNAALEEKENGRLRLKQEISELETQDKLLKDKYKAYKTKVISQERKNSLQSIKLDKLQKKHSDLEVSIVLKKEEIIKENSKLDNILSRHKFYMDLLESNGDKSLGIQSILRNQSKLKGICGVLSDLIDVKESHALAVEVALGDAANFLVVNTKLNALKIINWLKKSKIESQVSIIPLDVISLKKRQKKQNNKFLSATQYIKTQTQYKKLFDLLLSDVKIFTEGMDISKVSSDNPDFDWVTLDGQYFGKRYVLKSSRGSGKAVSIGRDKIIKNLEKDIVVIKKSLKTMNQKLNIMIDNANKIRKNIEQETKIMEIEITSMTELDKEISKMEYINNQNFERIKQSNKLIDNSIILINKLEKEKNKMSNQLKELQLKNDGYKTELKDIQVSIDELQSKRTKIQQELQDFRISLLEIEKEADGCDYRLNSSKKLKSDLKDKIKEYHNKSKILLKEIKIINVNTNDANKNKMVTISARETLQHNKTSLEKKYNEQYDEVQSLQNNIRSRQKKKEESLMELRDIELRIAGIEKEKELIINRINELYNTSIKYEFVELENIKIDNLEESIGLMARSIERIGPINMAVKDEFEEETERLNHLKEQYNDIVDSEINLQETIEKIDKEARTKLLGTFEKISENFKKTYTMFFDGGEASLRLVGEEIDPLDCDIEIIAKPPGKVTQTLRMLSTGEKALTAISLLFAIYLVKPSPFCILDEVDAPLDDRNIKKFTNAFREFAKETQFIVVTHNKLTMKNSDYLYGITQEEEGVSQVVSVRLEGDQVALPQA